MADGMTLNQLLIGLADRDLARSDKTLGDILGVVQARMFRKRNEDRRGQMADPTLAREVPTERGVTFLGVPGVTAPEGLTPEEYSSKIRQDRESTMRNIIYKYAKPKQFTDDIKMVPLGEYKFPTTSVEAESSSWFSPGEYTPPSIINNQNEPYPNYDTYNNETNMFNKRKSSPNPYTNNYR